MAGVMGIQVMLVCQGMILGHTVTTCSHLWQSNLEVKDPKYILLKTDLENEARIPAPKDRLEVWSIEPEHPKTDLDCEA